MIQPPQAKPERWGNSGSDNDLVNHAPGGVASGDGDNIDLKLQAGLQAGLPIGPENLWQGARRQCSGGPPTGSDRQSTAQANPTPNGRAKVMERRLPNEVDRPRKGATNGTGEGRPSAGAPGRGGAVGARKPPTSHPVAKHVQGEGPIVNHHGVDGGGPIGLQNG